MKPNDKNQRKQSLSTQHPYGWSMTIGMIIGMTITFIVGFLIDNIPAGIATGPALGAGIGFGVHGYLNRESLTKPTENKRPLGKIALITILIIGIVALISAYSFLIN